MKIIALNHKMNLYYEDLDEYIERTNFIDKKLLIAPSNIYLLEFIKKSHHLIASQDVCYLEDGNHTGKVSWSQMKSLGIKYTLIGHSEKNDSIEKVNAKLKSCEDNGITPILCFGNKTKTETPINCLEQITNLNSNIIYAYEPSYNISTGILDLNEVITNINDIYHYLKNKLHCEPTILYGGGINEANITQIYNLDKLSGILLGGKSANINNLEIILNSIEEK